MGVILRIRPAQRFVDAGAARAEAGAGASTSGIETHMRPGTRQLRREYRTAFPESTRARLTWSFIERGN